MARSFLPLFLSRSFWSLSRPPPLSCVRQQRALRALKATQDLVKPHLIAVPLSRDGASSALAVTEDTRAGGGEGDVGMGEEGLVGPGTVMFKGRGGEMLSFCVSPCGGMVAVIVTAPTLAESASAKVCLSLLLFSLSPSLSPCPTPQAPPPSLCLCTSPCAKDFWHSASLSPFALSLAPYRSPSFSSPSPFPVPNLSLPGRAHSPVLSHVKRMAGNDRD